MWETAHDLLIRACEGLRTAKTQRGDSIKSGPRISTVGLPPA